LAFCFPFKEKIIKVTEAANPSQITVNEGLFYRSYAQRVKKNGKESGFFIKINIYNGGN